MSTRFYFDDNVYWDGGTSNPTTPAYYSGWTETNSALRVGMKRGRPGNAFSSLTIQKNSSPNVYGLARAYVSDPVPLPFTLTGTIRGQLMALESNAAYNECRAVVVRIWNSTTNAFRTPAALVLLPDTVVSEFNAIGAQNRFFPPETAVTPVNVLKGDRIVVETGAAFFTTSYGALVTALFRTGNPAGSEDLPVDEAYTVPEAAPWIEFSMDFPEITPSRAPAFPVGSALAPSGGLDYLFELVSPDNTRYDVTERTAIEGLGKINLLIERNLHDFRAGDLTVTFDDGDGYFSDLFATIGPADRWHLNVHRDRARRFTGAILGIDSIRFDMKARTVEVTALDLSKLLEDYSADPVSRPADVYALGADVSAGATTLTLNSTAGLYNGDSLSLTDNATEEQVTIALITSSTGVTISDPIGTAFTAATTTVLLTTPFYRFQTPDFLINALLDVGADVISGRSIRLTSIGALVPLFSDVSTNRLGGTTVPNAFTQKGAKHFSRVGSASFEQTTPDADWTSVSPDRQWMDWSPYRTQAQGEPATFATLASGIVALGGDVDSVAIDYTVGAFVEYYLQAVSYGGGTPYIAVEIWKWTSSDGFTWSGSSFVTELARVQIALPPGFYPVDMTCEFDSARNRIYYHWNRASGSAGGFGYYDLGSSTQVGLGGGEKRTNGLRYSREYDGLVVYNATQDAIEIWRDSSVVLSYSGPLAGSWLPPYTRYFDGGWYAVAYPEAVPSVFFSSDALGTVTQISLASKTTGATDRRITIVNGTVRVAVNAPLVPGGVSTARYFVGAATFAGTIAYADFEGQSVINALDDLAILLNAVFSVDVEGIAHFVARSLDSGAEPKEIDELVVERTDEPIWLELYDYIEFQLAAGNASAGQKTSTSRNLSVDVQVVSSLSVGQAAAIFLLSFYSKQRRHVSVHLYEDGSVYSLLDPIRLDGIDWLVYSMQVDLAGYELDLELVEKVD